MGIILDIVPNHMSATATNRWWDDVLTHGPYSEFASYFDIRVSPNLPFKVQVCNLGQAYGEILRSGDLRIEVDTGNAGCDELLLFPSSSDPDQVDLLADAIGL